LIENNTLIQICENTAYLLGQNNNLTQDEVDVAINVMTEILYADVV
jgi:hypothetical protein